MFLEFGPPPAQKPCSTGIGEALLVVNGRLSRPVLTVSLLHSDTGRPIAGWPNWGIAIYGGLAGRYLVAERTGAVFRRFHTPAKANPFTRLKTETIWEFPA